MKFKNAYTPQKRQQVSFQDSPSLTKSEQADACDTNKILERFVRTGIIDHVQQHEPQYGDFENFDFQDAQNKVAAATQMFEALPAQTRQEFGNDPSNFLTFIAEEKNIRDMDDGIIGNTPPVDTQTGEIKSEVPEAGPTTT